MPQNEIETPDAWLSDYFNTGSATPVEKTASEEAANTFSDEDVEIACAVKMLEKRAEAMNVDLSEHTSEEILDTARELYMNKEASGEGAAPSDDPQVDNEAAQEFFELHKFAGKIQAHAMVSELRKMAAQQDQPADDGGGLEKEAKGIKGVLENLGTYARKGGEAVKGAEKKVSETVGSKLMSGNKNGPLLPVGKIDRERKARLRGRLAMGGAGAAAAGGGAAAAASGGKEKKGADESATEQLVQQRMYEMLGEANWLDSDGNVIAPDAGAQPEKTAADEIYAAVDAEALNRLAAAGYELVSEQ